MTSTNNTDPFEGETAKERRSRERHLRDLAAREAFWASLARFEQRIRQARHWWKTTGRTQTREMAGELVEWGAEAVGSFLSWAADLPWWRVTPVVVRVGLAGCAVFVAAKVAQYTPRHGSVTANGWQHTGLVATVTQPLHAFLTHHSAGLAIAPTAAVYVWQISGVALFGLAGVLRSTVARLAWTGWGAASAAMVWCGTEPAHRPIATGLAALAWTAASFFALRGLTLRPIVNVNNVVYPENHAARL